MAEKNMMIGRKGSSGIWGWCNALTCGQLYPKEKVAQQQEN